MVAKPPQSTRGNKGRVNLDRLVVQRAKGIKKDVDFNDLGQPIGASGAEIQSYIGVLARERAKVSFKLWRDVPQEVKNTIWDSIKLTFNVDDQWKKGCMESANTKWRQWKTYLYNKHIVPFENKPHMLYCPPSDSGILVEDWKNFVMSRLSVEFQKESEEQKERQRKNIYPHHISRRGYAGLREIMKDELTGDDEVDRAMLWKRARANKNGEFEGEILTRTISKIDEYTQQKKDGVFCKIHPTEDILTQALETPEHSGRVRAVGARVTPTIYFNLTKGMMRVGRSMQEMGKKVVEMDAKILELEAFIKSHFNKDVEKSSKSEKDSKGSCSVKNHDIQHIDDVIEVVDGYDSQKVKVHSPKAKRQKPPMSRMNNLITTDLPKILKLLYSYSRKVLINGSSIAMPLDDAVLGNYLTIYIFNEDVHNVCELLPISAACLCVYMWHLYKICASANLLGRIRFANPYDVSFSNNVDEDQRAGKVARRLIGALTNQLVLFPCNVGFHWILTVIDPHKEIVYLLDSLNHTVHDEQWKHAVNV